MLRRALPIAIAMAIAAVCSFVVSSAYGARGPAQAKAKQAARAAVLASPSYKAIDSPFKLKLEGCSRKGSRVTCVLYRSVGQACKLKGASKHSVCAMVVAHRAWTVRTRKRGRKVSASITRQIDQIGKFAPES